MAPDVSRRSCPTCRPFKKTFSGILVRGRATEDVLNVPKLAFGAFTHDKLEIEGRQGVQYGLKPCRLGAFLELGDRGLTHTHQFSELTLSQGTLLSDSAYHGP